MAMAAVVAAVGLAALIPHAPIRAETQTRNSLSLHVEETTGIRRTRYPVNAQVPFPPGALARADQVRLLGDDEEIPAQFAAGSRWPDGSVQWLRVDFNASIGPEETRSYRVEYGPGVSAGAGPGRGLALVEDADAIQVGRVRFSKTAAPLLASVSYRGEVIGSGRNGFAVEDTDGTVYELGGDTGVTFEIVRGGPIYVALRYSGRVSLTDGAEQQGVGEGDGVGRRPRTAAAATVVSQPAHVGPAPVGVGLRHGPLDIRIAAERGGIRGLDE